MRRRGTSGFTLVELTIVLTVIAIVMAFAIPTYVEMVRNTRAAEAIADLYAVRAAAYLYYGDHQSWPAETPTGNVPPELVPYLPRGFSFRRETYTLDWDNWGTGRGRWGQYYGNGVAVGISMITADRKLPLVVQSLLRNAAFLQTGSRVYTLQISSVNGF